MRTTISIILIVIIVSGCKFSKTVKKDLISGLTTTGSVLTCNDVYLSVNNERTIRTTFYYGEMIHLIFNDIRGFTREEGKVFPSMDILVTNSTGDTVLIANDLYSEYSEGMDYSPLELTADITIASPIRSGGDYTLLVSIKDKKGPGTYTSRLKFSVKENARLIVEKNGVSYSEAYLYSQGYNRIINDGKVKFDDNIYLIIEGLKGFKEENGLVFPGLSLTITDSLQNIILHYDDLLSEYNESGITSTDFSSRVSSHFKITGDEANNPLHCIMNVHDKKSNASIKITTDLVLQ
jgi:hypothetical protein